MADVFMCPRVDHMGFYMFLVGFFFSEVMDSAGNIWSVLIFKTDSTS